MKNPITLEQVLAFPLELTLESIGFHWWYLIFPVLAFVGYLMILHPFSEWFNVVGLISLVVGCIASMWLVLFTMPDVSSHGKAYYKEWLYEYAEPYVDSLPEEKVELAAVKYDYLLDEETGLRLRDYIPAKMTMPDGKEESLWVKVVYEEGLETPYLKGRHLEQNLSFNKSKVSWFILVSPDVEAGWKYPVLHTGDAAFKKYVKEADDKK